MKIVKVIIDGMHIDVRDNPSLLTELLPICDGTVSEDFMTPEEIRSQYHVEMDFSFETAMKERLKEEKERTFDQLIAHTKYLGTEMIDALLRDGQLDNDKHFAILVASGQFEGIEAEQVKIEYIHADSWKEQIAEATKDEPLGGSLVETHFGVDEKFDLTDADPVEKFILSFDNTWSWVLFVLSVYGAAGLLFYILRELTL
jgi:hypothetical protein